jgi:hypothetical protein
MKEKGSSLSLKVKHNLLQQSLHELEVRARLSICTKGC